MFSVWGIISCFPLVFALFNRLGKNVGLCKGEIMCQLLFNAVLNGAA